MGREVGRRTEYILDQMVIRVNSQWYLNDSSFLRPYLYARTTSHQKNDISKMWETGPEAGTQVLRKSTCNEVYLGRDLAQLSIECDGKRL
jgi:hypothetical protein